MRQKILFPTIITALIALSLLAWQQCGYWKNSIKLWDHSLQVSNENYYAHHYIALALLKEEKIDEAIYHYTECIRIYPDYIFAYMGRGLTYMMRNQHLNAVEDYNKAIRLKPDYVKAYFARGTTYFMLGQNQRAIKDLSEAIRLKPDFADAYNLRAVAYFKHGPKELGCRDAQKLCYSGYCQLLDEAKSKKLCP